MPFGLVRTVSVKTRFRSMRLESHCCSALASSGERQVIFHDVWVGASRMIEPDSRNGDNVLIGHVLIQERMTGRQELKIVVPMLFRRGRIHLQNVQKP